MIASYGTEGNGKYPDFFITENDFYRLLLCLILQTVHNEPLIHYLRELFHFSE